MLQPTRIYCLGLSHHTAPVDVRERFSFSQTDVAQAYRTARESETIAAFALLSTCNRVELYACAETSSEAKIWDALASLFPQRYQAGGDVLEDCLYRFEGPQVAEHVCRVAAGLDSMVLGEPQILGQVGDCLRTSQGQGMAGPLLTTLFQTAIKTGKRARSETALSRNPVSASSVAVQLATRAIGDLEGAQAAVVGMGEMGRLAVKALKARNLGRLVIVNRHVEKANQLANQIGCDAAPLSDLGSILATSDVVISVTAAEHLVITCDMVQAAMRGRSDRPLALLDLALPRDIEPRASEIEGVHLFDIDQLQTQVEVSLQERKKEIPAVEAIIADELERFSIGLREAEVQPVIADLRRKAEAIRRQELERVLNTMDSLDEKTAEQLGYFSRALVNKLLHDPTIRLRQEAVNGEAAPFADMVRRLFAL